MVLLQRSHNVMFSLVSGITKSMSHMLSVAVCAREFQNDALWDTIKHVLSLDRKSVV